MEGQDDCPSQSINREVWKVTETKFEVANENAPTPVEEKKLQCNDIAISALHEALDDKTFEQIKNIEIAHDAWVLVSHVCTMIGRAQTNRWLQPRVEQRNINRETQLLFRLRLTEKHFPPTLPHPDLERALDRPQGRCPSSPTPASVFGQCRWRPEGWRYPKSERPRRPRLHVFLDNG